MSDTTILENAIEGLLKGIKTIAVAIKGKNVPREDVCEWELVHQMEEGYTPVVWKKLCHLKNEGMYDNRESHTIVVIE